MIDKIIKSYEKLNKSLLRKKPFNNEETRNKVAVRLESELQYCNIICDETNNPPEIVDKCICVARVEWLNMGVVLNYVDLVFGNAKQIAKIKVNSTLNKD